MAVVDPSLEDALDEWFIEALNGLARSPHPGIDGVLQRVVAEREITGTRGVCDLHVVRCDGNGRPQVRALVRHLTERIIDYCIPQGRIDEAAAYFDQGRSGAAWVRLNREARALFVDADTTGELGELLLFALLEELVGAPQVLSKISLKTNSRVHYHGVDGVHVRARIDGGIDLYWGEAKIYASFGAAVSSCFKSLDGSDNPPLARQDPRRCDSWSVGS
ncbi:MAG: DUF1837 domain-containing protein [Actinomycetia bacterium]|nr:DUF1837 domain-containing protein [Actinomycetes bacterium]